MVQAELEFEIDEIGGASRITPILNGRPLPVLVEEFEKAHGYNDPAGGYAGLIPEFYRFARLTEHFLGVADDACDRVYLLGCECGEVGCWPILAVIEASETTVSWSRFMQPYRKDRDYSDFGPFVFDRQEYEVALASIEHVWKTPS